MAVVDAYQQFFKLLPKEKFFEFGLKHIISIDRDVSKNWWNLLKEDVNRKSTGLFVRSSGRNGSGNTVVKNLYKYVFGIDINFDATNNAKPTKLLEYFTHLKKNKTIFNYQVSHVFGQTKNVFCFTAPWNIVFIPKIVDPFTGHEAMGDYVDEFKKCFRKEIYSMYEDMIVEYNELMKIYRPKVKEWLDAKVGISNVQKYLKDFEDIIA